MAQMRDGIPEDNGALTVVICRKQIGVSSVKPPSPPGSAVGAGGTGTRRQPAREGTRTGNDTTEAAHRAGHRGLFALLTAVASAEMHRLQVTLVTGQVLTVTVDVPPGTPVSEMQIPGLPGARAEHHRPRTGRDADARARRPSAGADAPAAVGPHTVGPHTPAPHRRPPRRGPLAERRRLRATVRLGRRPERRRRQQWRRRVGIAGGRQDAGRGPWRSRRRPARPSTRTASRWSERSSAARRPTRRTRRSTPTARPRSRTRRSRSPAGPRRIGVPNFFIEKFRIPPFLLPIYQAAGIQYGVRWEVLAAINEIETDYGRNLNVSSAGARRLDAVHAGDLEALRRRRQQGRLQGPVQPGRRDLRRRALPARRRRPQDLHKAIFSYNHAEWYVDSVLLRARVIGGLPAGLVGSLTGLTQGRFPVLADATYANSVSKAAAPQAGQEGAGLRVRSNARRNGIKIFARRARRSSPSTTARSCASGAASGSAASSRSRTSTATSTPTGA